MDDQEKDFLEDTEIEDDIKPVKKRNNWVSKNYNI